MERVITTTIGDAKVSIITDGAVTFTPDLFPGTDEASIDAILKAARADAIETNFNAVLIQRGDRVILIDSGPRDLFGPTCGFLLDGLKELGATVDQIDTLVATHLHPDHVAGMITAEGVAVFPNATLHVTAPDREFWSDESNFTGALAGIADWAQLAKSVLMAYSDRLEVQDTDAQIAPGLRFMALPGHTPGHAGWRLDAGGGQLVHVGDIVHAPVLQLARPDIAISFDIDMDTARATRQRLLDELASDGTLFTGGHMLQPGLNRLERDGKGYSLVAEG